MFKEGELDEKLVYFILEYTVLDDILKLKKIDNNNFWNHFIFLWVLYIIWNRILKEEVQYE